MGKGLCTNSVCRKLRLFTQVGRACKCLWTSSIPRLAWEAASLSSSRTLIAQSRPLSWTLFISLTAMTRLGFRGDCAFLNLTLGFHYAGILTTEMALIFMVECRETFWFCEQFQLHLTTTTLTTICSIQMGLYKPTFPLAVTFKPFFGHLTRAPMAQRYIKALQGRFTTICFTTKWIWMSVKEKTLLKNVNFNIENITNPWIPGARRIQKVLNRTLKKIE